MSQKISDLTEKTSLAADDLFVIADSAAVGNKKVKYSTIQQQSGVYHSATLIPSANVLTSNATPVLLITSPGAGKAIQVLGASLHLKFNTTQYNTNTNGLIITDTATDQQFEKLVLSASSDAIYLGIPTATGGGTETQIITDKGVYFQTASGNPATGDSDIVVYLAYKIIDTTL